MTRAYNELEDHYNRYHRDGLIFVANRGSVWHTDASCYRLQNCYFRDLWGCQTCAQDVMTPHIQNEHGVTLENAITQWLVTAQFFDAANHDNPMFQVVPGGGSASSAGAAESSAPT